jgi:hypothetical protein
VHIAQTKAPAYNVWEFKIQATQGWQTIHAAVLLITILMPFPTRQTVSRVFQTHV